MSDWLLVIITLINVACVAFSWYKGAQCEFYAKEAIKEAKVCNALRESLPMGKVVGQIYKDRLDKIK